MQTEWAGEVADLDGDGAGGRVAPIERRVVVEGATAWGAIQPFEIPRLEGGRYPRPRHLSATTTKNNLGGLKHSSAASLTQDRGMAARAEEQEEESYDGYTARKAFNQGAYSRTTSSHRLPHGAPVSPGLCLNQLTAARRGGRWTGVCYTYDDVIFLPGHIFFAAHEVSGRRASPCRKLAGRRA